MATLPAESAVPGAALMPHAAPTHRPRPVLPETDCCSSTTTSRGSPGHSSKGAGLWPALNILVARQDGKSHNASRDSAEGTIYMQPPASVTREADTYLSKLRGYPLSPGHSSKGAGLWSASNILVQPRKEAETEFQGLY